ncbi:sulfatase family protein [Mucisphaera calidilacus]|uniref:Arylsulfatase n=1 Tax=Mucisphaera calidilacus TaxID=2527982 RepID=A0A518BUG6_9BACT|nr:arylsulfatase [Mucisphaera calidilacus]QDU70635.1 Arylsulfatase [Mucisphaera calidilacus]
MNKDHPNILYIFADDWGYGDISCLNPDSKIHTPCTDKLAEQGMTFTDAHSSSAVCTPSRYSVLTGRYCWRGPLKSSVLGGWDELLIEDDRMTVASLLRDKGYRTACIGKWHLGLGWHHNTQPPTRHNGFYEWNDDRIDVDFTKTLTKGPHTVGFDVSFIIPASLDIVPYCFIENGHVHDLPMRHVEDSPRPAEYRGGPCARGLQHETVLLEFTNRAEQFIADHARESPDKPFFLYLPLPSPHTPHVPREPFQGTSECGAYGDYVVEHDWSIGRVLETLERSGLADDTLVIVTSDNGAHIRGQGMKADMPFDFEQQYGHRSNHIYRGQKTDAWDGGHRIPYIARWPGVIEPGSTCDHPICLTDLLATVAELHGEDLPDDAGEDSLSTLPLMHQQQPGSGRQAIVHHSGGGEFAIRQGNWKLIDCPGSGGWSMPPGKVPDDAPPRQLYNLDNDIEEQHNLIGQHPDVEQRLLTLLDQYKTNNRSVDR